MPWITTKSGKHINTDWFDDEKEKQIAKNQEQASQASDHERHKPLESIEDAYELQQEMHKMFIEEDSYINSKEFKELESELHKARTELDESKKKFLELCDVVKKETTIDEDILKQFEGDKDLARMFSKKTPKGEAAEKEKKLVLEKSKEIEQRVEALSNKHHKIQVEQSEIQQDAFKRADITARPATKEKYSGFQKNTGTSYYENLREKGKAQVFEMSPQEYMRYCAYKIFPGSTYENQIRAAIGDAKHTMDLVKLMKNGTEMYMPVLNFRDREQEGRHRAVAAMILGIERIPVLIVK